MARYCELCGKQTMAGRHVRHAHSIGWKFRAPKKPRTFKPNLRNAKVVDGEGKVSKVTVCMKCYKRLQKDQADAEAKIMAAAE